MVLDMTRGMAEFGPAVVQQFDQGSGPRACYATNHGHTPVPGPWMTTAFDGPIKADGETARSVNPTVAMSCEGAPPEIYLQDFQIWDARAKTCPLYSFLYHEYANGHEGFYTNRVNDEALRLSAARALVTGYIVNFTLRDKGQIEYDWTSHGSAPFQIKAPSLIGLKGATNSGRGLRATILFLAACCDHGRYQTLLYTT